MPFSSSELKGIKPIIVGRENKVFETNMTLINMNNNLPTYNSSKLQTNVKDNKITPQNVYGDGDIRKSSR